MAEEPTSQLASGATVVDQHPLLTPKALACVALLALPLTAVGFAVAGRLIGVAGFVGALACCGPIIWLYWPEIRSALRERAWRKDLILPSAAFLIVAIFDAVAVFGGDGKPAASNAPPGTAPASSHGPSAQAGPASTTTTRAPATAPPAAPSASAPATSPQPEPAGQGQKPAQPKTKLEPPQAGPPPAASPPVTDELLANARPYPEPYVPPTTPFSALSNQSLRNRVASTCARLRAFENAYNADAKGIAATGANAGADQFPKLQKQLDDRRASGTPPVRAA